jgi:flagellar biosynthesis component FlhA
MFLLEKQKRGKSDMKNSKLPRRLRLTVLGIILLNLIFILLVVLKPNVFNKGIDLVLLILMFIIISITQIYFVGKSCSRIAETAARFMLDAFPTKQMHIESDLEKAMISEDEANAKKMELQCECDYFGAMDGTMKFINTLGKILFSMILVAVIFCLILRKLNILSIETNFIILCGIISHWIIIILTMFASQKINDTVLREN